LKKSADEDDSEKIEEMISDKPKKPKANTNTNRKKAEATRDVADNSAAPSNKDEKGEGSVPANKKEPANSANPNDRQAPKPAANTKPAGQSTGRPSSGDGANRAVPRPR
jgi:hypothetical protein